MEEVAIQRFMARLYGRIEMDSSTLRKQLSDFLTEDAAQHISLMNSTFFSDLGGSLLSYLNDSFRQASKYESDYRKIIYEFCASYISEYADRVLDYIPILIEYFARLFRFETEAKSKQATLLPIISIIETYESETLIEKRILDPAKMHETYTGLLKSQKYTPSVKGQIWLLVGCLQGKFPHDIDMDSKREVQEMCLFDLKALVKENKNFSTIALILKSLHHSLGEVLLSPNDLKDLYSYVSTLLLPLTNRYEVPIKALELLSERSSVFSTFILANARKLFSDLCSLVNHRNREYQACLNEAIIQVVKQIVIGIQAKLSDSKMEPLYVELVTKTWKMLQSVSDYTVRGDQSAGEKFKYNIITTLKILGCLSPLVKHYETSEKLRKFFVYILDKCLSKINRSFEEPVKINLDEGKMTYDDSENSEFGSSRRLHIKFYLYNQKELISFLSSLSQIVYNLEQVTEREVAGLEKIFLTAVRQSPFIFVNYRPRMITAMVNFLICMEAKYPSFSQILKRMVSESLKELLDTKKHNVNTDKEYYKMIEKCSSLWAELLNHEKWTRNSLNSFGETLFESIEYLIEKLDISYKSNIQLSIEEDESEEAQSAENNMEEMVQIFFLSSETIHMSNIQEYQYLCSLALVFEDILTKTKTFSYHERSLEFYKVVLERLRTYPKCIPIMKVLRCLNSFIDREGVLLMADFRELAEKYESMGESFEGNTQSKSKQFKVICETIFENNIRISKLAVEEFIGKAKGFYFEVTQKQLQKYQEQHLYECLKLLISFPVEVYLQNNCEILKTNFSSVLNKSLEIGQEILTLVNSSIECVSGVFRKSKASGERFLVDVIPKMEKFIWTSSRDEESPLEESDSRIYVFVSERRVTRPQVSKKIMEFLGSIGGLAHMLVDSASKDYVSWDYQCRVDVSVLINQRAYDINLTKLLDRACFLALNGELHLKRASCEYLHGVITYVVGKSANKLLESKQVTASFFDRILPTVLQVASNSSHPSQQLLHTLLIQSIRFFAHTQEPNSPDITTVLKHLLALYNGTEDMSCLASKCLSQFVRWHIKCSPKKTADYPVVKVIFRNVWNLVSNRKAREGLILLLVELLKEIHREEPLMREYVMTLCDIVVTIARSNELIEKEFQYLVLKIVRSLSIVIKSLIIESQSKGDKYKKFSTLHDLLQYLFQKCFFSYYRQQRYIAFLFWKEIIGRYKQYLGYSCLEFLSARADRHKRYLFKHMGQRITEDMLQESQQIPENFDKLLSKVVAMSEVWTKLSQEKLFPVENLIHFNDLKEIFVESYVNALNYLICTFPKVESRNRHMPEEIQKNIVLLLKGLPNVLREYLGVNRNTGQVLKGMFLDKIERKMMVRDLIEFLLKFILRPNSLIPNFNFDLISEKLSNKQITAKKGFSFSEHTIEGRANAEANEERNLVSCVVWFVIELSKPRLKQAHQIDLESRSALTSSSSECLQTFYSVVTSIYRCKESELISFLFRLSSPSEEVHLPFSNSFINRQVIASGSSQQVYERQTKIILKTLLEFQIYCEIDQSSLNHLIKDLIRILQEKWDQLPNDKKSLIVQMVLSFRGYQEVHKFILDIVEGMTMVFVKYDKFFIRYIVSNFQAIGEEIFKLIKVQPKVINLLYLLNRSLNTEDLALFYGLIQKYMTHFDFIERGDNQFEEDYLKVHYMCAQSVRDFNRKTSYIEYVKKLFQKTLDIDKSQEVHTLSINLAAVVLNRLDSYSVQYRQFKNVVSQSLSSVSCVYFTYLMSQLEPEDKKSSCVKYLTDIQSLTLISQDVYFLEHLFIGFKDTDLKGRLKESLDSVVKEIITNVYARYSEQRQHEVLEWVMKYFQDQNDIVIGNKRFRCTIIEKLFVKLVHSTHEEVLIRFFHIYCKSLLGIIYEDVPPMSVEAMVTEYYIRKAAFMILEHLYFYLPKPLKDKSRQVIHKDDFHKKIITRTILLLKNRLNNASLTLMEEHDRKCELEAMKEIHKLPVEKQQEAKSRHKKGMTALKVYREFTSAAYNCLIIVFINTQSKPEQFKKFIFDKGEALWENIIDPEKKDFNFTIETDFRMMKPIELLHKSKDSQRRRIQEKYMNRIKEEYMMGSLYIIEEENVPRTAGQQLQVVKEEEKIGSPQDSGKMEIQENESKVQKRKEPLLARPLQEDLINRHPVMVNLIRVIDFMEEEFAEQFSGRTPIWMKPIHDELMSEDLALSVRVFLTKVIVNRPNVFKQEDMWGPCLVKYLILKENGAQFIHYFYRDALLQLIKFVKAGYKPDALEMSKILNKLVVNMPHENSMIYSSNIDILEEIMKLVPGVYVDRVLVNKLLSTKAAPEKEKNQFEWRMCGCIVMKSCLVFEVPLISHEEYLEGKIKDPKFRFKILKDYLDTSFVKIIQQLVYENNKKYRVAASGLFGEWLRFINAESANYAFEQADREKFTAFIKRYIREIFEKQQNRNGKERFSLIFANIVQRFPLLLNDNAIFSIMDTVIVNYKNEERLYIVETAIVYIEFLGKSQNGVSKDFIRELMMNFRLYLERFISDSFSVYRATIRFLKCAAKYHFFDQKQILQAYAEVLPKLEKGYAESENEPIARDFYDIVLVLKDYLLLRQDQDRQNSLIKSLKISSAEVSELKEKIQQILIAGLGSMHASIRRTILQHFERSFMEAEQLQSKLITIFKSLYVRRHESLWLTNVVPLIFSIAKKSSEYTKYIFDRPLQEATKKYDWDFRNMKFANSSQPYTPMFSLFPNAAERLKSLSPSQQASGSIVPSIGSNRVGGLIRATQNSYLSQQDQVFTMLASQSEDGSGMSLGSFSEEGEEMLHRPSNPALSSQEPEQQRDYATLNNIFMTSKRRNKIIESQAQNQEHKNYEPAVNLFGDKIRFKPKNLEGVVSKRQFNFKRKPKKRNFQSHSTRSSRKANTPYRTYKLGELPNIEISLANILEPLIEMCCFDKEIASDLFTVFFSKIVFQDQHYQKDLRDILIELLQSSTEFDFSFVSTLQKCLIGMCSEGHQIIDLSMKDIAVKSNTLDYGIVFTEENLIQSLGKSKSLLNRDLAMKEDELENLRKLQWSDLIDLYQHNSQTSILPPLLKKITKPFEYKSLSKVLKYKEQGSIKEEQQEIEKLFESLENQRLGQFLESQKNNCLALLGQWQTAERQLTPKILNDTISQEQTQILVLSLLNNTESTVKQEVMKKVNFPENKYDYQKALSSLMVENMQSGFSFDRAEHFSNKSLQNFHENFKKTTSFDFNSKHEHLETIQKVFEMREFLKLYSKKDIYTSEIVEVLNSWVNRQPNSLYDSEITWVSIMESRLMYTRLLSSRFQISEEYIQKVVTDYIVQNTRHMLSKGIQSYAETLIRKALRPMRSSKVFNWGFYKTIVDIKLVQFKKVNCIDFSRYQSFTKMLITELAEHQKADAYSDIEYLFIETSLTKGFLECCSNAMSIRDSQQPSLKEMVQRTSDTYNSYKQIMKSYELLSKELQSGKKLDIEAHQLQPLNCKIHYEFSMFLEYVLSMTKGKYHIKELADQMKRDSLSLGSLTQMYASELIEGLSLMNSMDFKGEGFGGGYSEKLTQEQRVFDMVLKLIKTVQIEKGEVGAMFAEAINDKKLPTWIFLYFIPQIIKTLNEADMVIYFQDLFHNILRQYPESLVYNFNCSYERKAECRTEYCEELFGDLHKKAPINFKFIQALQFLHHPEMRLREILNKFTIIGEDETALEELEELVQEDQLMGKYNKKFYSDRKKMLHHIISLMRERSASGKKEAQRLIEQLQKGLDPKSKENVASMKNFSKMSDGSLFFEEYNSNDWPRIEVPATNYCRFQEPLAWNKVYIESFDLSMLTLSSIRKPKRITVYGSNEKKYMFLVKGGEDVRLDQRIEELFNLVNRILSSDAECSKKGLEIKRFEVIPIKKMLGIFEWVDESQTLRSVLEREYREIKHDGDFAEGNPAYKKYMKFLKNISPDAKDIASLYTKFLGRPEKDVVFNLNACENEIPFGLLRKTLQRLSKSNDFYLHIKNQFISNYAVVCVVGYILGIGDRHLENFLIHAPTASVVMIDFGYSFGSSRDLAVPELMPFRLTKCLTELMEPVGFDGIFKQTMIKAFSALQKHKELIVSYCDIFIDDPLMEWVWKCKRENPKLFSTEHVSMSVSQEPPEKKKYSQRVENVNLKLLGVDPRKILLEELRETKHSKTNTFYGNLTKEIREGGMDKQRNMNGILPVDKLIDQLISLASDKNIIGRSYIGLNPYI